MRAGTKGPGRLSSQSAQKSSPPRALRAPRRARDAPMRTSRRGVVSRGHATRAMCGCRARRRAALGTPGRHTDRVRALVLLTHSVGHTVQDRHGGAECASRGRSAITDDAAATQLRTKWARRERDAHRPGHAVRVGRAGGSWRESSCRFAVGEAYAEVTGDDVASLARGATACQRRAIEETERILRNCGRIVEQLNAFAERRAARCSGARSARLRRRAEWLTDGAYAREPRRASLVVRAERSTRTCTREPAERNAVTDVTLISRAASALRIDRALLARRDGAVRATP